MQFLALHVATASDCLYRQLQKAEPKKLLETHILNDITRILVHLKPLVSWLDRSPFQGQGHAQFVETRDNIMKFGLELATVAQRDRFVENPVEQVNQLFKNDSYHKHTEMFNFLILLFSDSRNSSETD